MKIIATPILVLFTIVFSSCGAQKSETYKTRQIKEVKEIVALGKDSIVKLAFTLVDKNARLQNFAKTSVQTNGKEVYVLLSNPIMYLPINTIYYTAADVNLTTEQVSLSTVANPIGFTSDESIPYYFQTTEATKHIAFVLKALKNADNSDSSVFGSTQILEKENHYEIGSGTATYYMWCKVKKVSGEVYDEGYEQLAINPVTKNKKDSFSEIKFTKEN